MMEAKDIKKTVELQIYTGLDFHIVKRAYDAISQHFALLETLQHRPAPERPVYGSRTRLLQEYYAYKDDFDLAMIKPKTALRYLRRLTNGQKICDEMEYYIRSLQYPFHGNEKEELLAQKDLRYLQTVSLGQGANECDLVEGQEVTLQEPRCYIVFIPSIGKGVDFYCDKKLNYGEEEQVSNHAVTNENIGYLGHLGAGKNGYHYHFPPASIALLTLPESCCYYYQFREHNHAENIILLSFPPSVKEQKPIERSNPYAGMDF
jgi:hypothetical protein